MKFIINVFKTAIFLLVLSVGSVLPQQSPPEIEWERTFGGSKQDQANSIVSTPDGGYAVAGFTESKGAGGSDIWVLKLDAHGEILWDKAFGGGGKDQANAIVSTPDGGYAIAGFTDSKGAGNHDLWVLKLNARGNLLWDRTFGGVNWDQAESIVSTSDGGFVVAGFTSSKGAGGHDVWILKLDASGNLLWDKTFGGSKYDLAYSIVSTPDGGYAVAGFTESKGAGSWDAWVLKLDASGNLLWDKTFGGNERDEFHSVVSTFDGGIVVAGTTYSKGGGGFDVWVLKLDSRGDLLWATRFGGSEVDVATSLNFTPGGGYAVAGITKSKGEGDYDIWLLNLDARGNLLWDKTFGGKNQDWATSILLTLDGGYAVAGYTKSKGAGESDIWAVKLKGKESIVVAADKVLPKISIYQPQVVRGMRKTNEKVISVRGKATDESGIYEVLVNGADAQLSSDGTFWADVRLRIGDNTFVIVAEDTKGNRATKSFTVIRESSSKSAPPLVVEAPQSSTGDYWALIIGIDDYDSWDDLKTPMRDASTLRRVLLDNYTFDDDRVFTIYNNRATRHGIMDAMDELVNRVQPNDNLLIFYAGHGYLDEKRNEGYWVPQDARKGKTADYVSNADIRTQIGGMDAKHVLLISDACFAGSLFRSGSVSMPFEDMDRYYREVIKLPSRKALTSGGTEPVSDGGRDGHSVFAYYLLRALRDNDKQLAVSGELFNRLKIAVTNNSEQKPEHGVIKNTGDEGGEFVFIRR